MPTAGLDHVGLFAYDLAEISGRYERLGFSLTPWSQHAGSHGADQATTIRGTANRCAMLRRGYLELLAVVDPTKDTIGVPEALARYAGLHILAFRTEDPNAEMQRLAAHGFAPYLATLQRPVDIEGVSQLACFTQVRVPPESLPEARIFAIRHETPELLWRESCLGHPNGALSLDGVIVVTDDLEVSADRLARFTGALVESAPGSRHLTLGPEWVRLMDSGTFSRRFPDSEIPSLPFPACFAIGVDDLDKTARILERNGVRHVRTEAGIRVAADEAGGTSLLFQPSGVTPET